MEISPHRIWELEQRVQAVLAMVRERMHQHFIDEPDMEYLIIGSTIVRAHPCAAGASSKKGATLPGSSQKQRRIQHEDSRLRRDRNMTLLRQSDS